MTASFAFDLQREDDGARRGRLTLPHGVIETPAFMPVGTRGAIKGLTLDQVTQLDPDIILANTYHLHLRPGDELIGSMGGLHAYPCKARAQRGSGPLAPRYGSP